MNPKDELYSLDQIDQRDHKIDPGHYWVARAILVLAIQVARIATRLDHSVGPGGVLMFRQQR